MKTHLPSAVILCASLVLFCVHSFATENQTSLTASPIATSQTSGGSTSSSQGGFVLIPLSSTSVDSQDAFLSATEPTIDTQAVETMVVEETTYLFRRTSSGHTLSRGRQDMAGRNPHGILPRAAVPCCGRQSILLCERPVLLCSLTGHGKGRHPVPPHRVFGRKFGMFPGGRTRNRRPPDAAVRFPPHVTNVS